MQSIDLTSGSGKLSSDSVIGLNEAIKYIFKSKKATIITGAGISCNAGIPDFRSDDGLYNMVKHKYPKSIVRGQDLFDINLFRDDVSLSIFCTFMESLYKSSLRARPTETHKFIKHLKDKGKLLRCYTQNIDSLEQNLDLNLGIDSNEFDEGRFRDNWSKLDVVQLHGNLHKLSCTSCFSQFEWNEEFQRLLNEGKSPECSRCYDKYQERLYSGKRLTGQIGILRPDIVLYGENHPQSEIIGQGLNSDLKSKPDLLLIMGTSLKVDGVKKLVRSLSNEVHKKGGKVVFVNKTKLSKSWEKWVDYEVLCDCDEFVRIMKKQVPDLFLTQEQIDSKKLKNKAEQVLVDQEAFAAPVANFQIKREKGVAIKQESFDNFDISSREFPDVKVKLEPGSEEEPSRKNEIKIKTEIKTKVKTEIPTPPVTPTKKRKSSSSATAPSKRSLKRRSANDSNQEDVENRTKRLKSSLLPTPATSFCDDESAPLKSYSSSQLNRIIIID
ncbi:uncharacterized protein LODBEIA_P56780 [Lodderomyces beijingensis]|uniref:Deacetylase sirtuin-type domain-containing protein n=1 Tax=Lodderomyces beijingensis TaxID=1775926 RepID=A0ABP0ZTI5_9ASCO